MNEHNTHQTRDAVSGWEDDGGAQRSGDRRRSEQDRLDQSHQSDTRGEHRYQGVHQTGAEQQARQERDDLKQRLAGRTPRRAC